MKHLAKVDTWKCKLFRQIIVGVNDSGMTCYNDGMDAHTKQQINNNDVGFIKTGTRTALIIQRSCIKTGTHIQDVVIYAQEFDVIGEVALELANDIVRGIVCEREGVTLPATWRLLLREWREWREQKANNKKPFRPNSTTR